MAKVIITENDLTSSAISVDTTDIAYIPGFGDPHALGEQHKPVLITSSSQFIKYFGDCPRAMSVDYKFSDHADEWDEGSYADSEDKDGYLIRQGDPDPSYIYAMELLNADMPIYYERINNGELIDPQDMYTAFTTGNVAGEHVHGTESIFDKLIDKGTFNIKYITTGGWPVWDYVDKSEYVSYKSVPCYEMTVTCKLDIVALGCHVYIAITDNKFKSIYFDTYERSNDYEMEIEYARDEENKIVPDTFIVRVYNKSQFEMVDISEECTFDMVVDGHLDGSVISIAQKADVEIEQRDENKLHRPIVDTILAICMQRTENDMLTGRGDCLALIDHTNCAARDLQVDSKTSVYRRVNDYNTFGGHLQNTGSFGAMFTPWETYTLSTVVREYEAHGRKGNLITSIDLPGSFAYLRSLAKYVKDYSKNHEAVAGPIRGRVAGAKPRLDRILTNTIADAYQSEVSLISGINDSGKVSINAITEIYPYNQVIWGNRTLAPKDDEDGVKATHFINIRNMVSDIRKAAYRAARKYMFEQNSEILWFNFKSELIPTLENFKTSYGITAYKIKKIAQEKTWLHVEVIIKPVYAVEEFKINLVIQDEDVTVDETDE